MSRLPASPLIGVITNSLRKARAARGLTQRGLGERVGMPQSHVSKIEQGMVDLQLSSLAEMARALDLELRLVPRTALPAVDGLIHSLTTDKQSLAQQPALTLDDEDD
ncbi:helix-turn-helix domain-containing protein [Sphingobium yanoikuyae]|uniref:Transcriptional regulator n=1 Tax=Sphingobium yanoikuyae TaxID=13690 RepID=A0A291MZM1_SPHYA|nr:helix-turn-helix transcriptional regulator [Sphingobium yanoikuyae]ATI80563.1 transcriptional regulator [Sphingobium yanoikuyae]